MTTSKTAATHPSWYPLFLKELESTHPDIYQEITSAVIGRNAERQVAARRLADAVPPVSDES